MRTVWLAAGVAIVGGILLSSVGGQGDARQVVVWGSVAENASSDGSPGYIGRLGSPLTFGELDGATQIDAGCYHGLARMEDGTVQAWGNNWNGQLGDGTMAHRPRPVSVQGLQNVRQVAAGCWTSFALLDDGTVMGWGDNARGGLGDGTVADRRTPVKVVGVAGATSLVAGGGYAAVVLANGSVMGWGDQGGSLTLAVAGLAGPDANGCTMQDLETGKRLPCQKPTGRTARPVPGVHNVSALAIGSHYTLALLQNGTVRSWGWNYQGTLGDGTTTSTNRPVTVVGLHNVTMVSAGSSHALAVREDGTVAAWGENRNGELGDGTTTERLAPVTVPNLSGVVAVSAKGHKSLAVLSNGLLMGWGLDGNHLDAETSGRTGPKVVCGVEGVQQVAGGTPDVALLGTPSAQAPSCPNAVLNTLWAAIVLAALVSIPATVLAKRARSAQWAAGATAWFLAATAVVTIAALLHVGDNVTGRWADVLATRIPSPAPLGLAWLAFDLAIFAGLLVARLQPGSSGRAVWLGGTVLAGAVAAISAWVTIRLGTLQDYHMTSVDSWDRFLDENGSAIGLLSATRWLLAATLVLASIETPGSFLKRRVAVLAVGLGVAGFLVMSWSVHNDLQGPGIPLVPTLLGWLGLGAAAIGCLVASWRGAPGGPIPPASDPSVSAP